MNSLLCALLLVVASRSVAATFSTTCTKISFNPANDDLTALCVVNPVGDPFTTINLNSCVGNTDGKLAAGTDFSSSCSNVSVSGVTLSATCATPAGGSDTTSLDLGKNFQQYDAGDFINHSVPAQTPSCPTKTGSFFAVERKRGISEVLVSS
ncbi:hypothetical protein DFH06DRAFT_1365928 [Mycena polygramma]|nr:hypothetical protein DFH06DRAFT_1365928 [Mycena polygramma]